MPKTTPAGTATRPKKTKTVLYVTAEDMATARNVKDPATIRKAVDRNRAKSQTHPRGEWPTIGIPKPDQFRPLLLWRADRPDVIKYMKGGGPKYPNLADETKLRALLAEHGTPFAVARAEGVRPYLVTWWMDVHGIPVDTAARSEDLADLSLDDMRALITEHRSIKAAAKAVGKSENTFLRRLRRAETAGQTE